MKQNHKTIAAVLLCVLLAVCAVPGVCAKGETLTCIVADGQYVNVRNRASSSAATWGILHTGDQIEAEPKEITNGFFKTTFNDRVAYVSVRYFEIPDDAQYLVEANGRVRLRTAPLGDADGFIKPGEKVYVTAWRYAADGSKWAKCTGGVYISADYLKPEKEERAGG